ncbi:MAG TPA: chemotaxis protein CheW [Steroidobacteraceae bacterium]|nr:chemotaxis protein CheW [Steroidobacteraceae bacterium]
MTRPSTDPTAAAQGAMSQVLTFVIGDVTYGIDIPCVQEIRGWTAVTRLPQSPADILGVLNLRGAIVPVLDLRLKFGSSNVQYTPVTVIVVVSVMSATGPREFGMVVDGVSDVIDIAAQDVKPAPDLGNAASAACIRGLATIGGRMVVLLDVNLLLGKESAAAGPEADRAA